MKTGKQIYNELANLKMQLCNRRHKITLQTKTTIEELETKIHELETTRYEAKP